MPEGKKYGGRKKGTPNKTTSETRQLVQHVVAEQFDEFKKRMKELPDKEFCQVYLQMCKFVIPSLQSVKIEDGSAVKMEVIERLKERNEQM